MMLMADGLALDVFVFAVVEVHSTCVHAEFLLPERRSGL